MTRAWYQALYEHFDGYDEEPYTQSTADEVDFLEAAIMLCEGGFSLVETDAMDRAILQGAFSAIKPGGVFIMTSPNAEFMLARLSENEGFDPSTRRETFELEAIDEHGVKQLLNCTQRYYRVDELSKLLAGVGFAGMEAFRVSRGYERGISPTEDDFEFGMIASVTALSQRESPWAGEQTGVDRR